MKLTEFFNNEKTKKQIMKLLYALIVCLALLLVVELLFQIPAVKNAFSTDVLSDSMGNSVAVWVVLWLLMYAQVTIIPVPAMPIYVFCNSTSLVSYGEGLFDLFSLRTVFFVLFVTSACVVGAMSSYWLGRLGGKKAVKWIAGDEEDYNLWSEKLNNKVGKYIYAGTVLLPVFPDDILCLVAGAMKMDFGFFTIVNISGRVIGAYCMLLFMRLPYISSFFTSSVNGGFPWALLVYAILLVASIIATILWKKWMKKSCI